MVKYSHGSGYNIFHDYNESQSPKTNIESQDVWNVTEHFEQFFLTGLFSKDFVPHTVQIPLFNGFLGPDNFFRTFSHLNQSFKARIYRRYLPSFSKYLLFRFHSIYYGDTWKKILTLNFIIMTVEIWISSILYPSVSSLGINCVQKL